MGRMLNRNGRKNTSWPKGGRWMQEVQTFALPESSSKAEGKIQVPKFEKGETMGIDGFSHCWFQGFGANGNIRVIIAGHEKEGVIEVAPARVRYSAQQLPEPYRPKGS